MNLKGEEKNQGKKRRVIRVRPGEKPRLTPDALRRLRQSAEEKGWMKKGK